MSVDSNTPLDPRVQVELEKLNSATDDINKFEVELDEAKTEFKRLLAESVEKIKQSAHKLGNSIETAKPYYEARLYATQLAKETQVAGVNYDKAKSVHAAAKEMVYLAEQGLGEKSTLDTACQEMLSHAASRVNQSQLECTDTRNVLKICELKQEVANNRVAKLQAQLKSAIRSSSMNIRRNLLLINLLAYQRELCCLPYYETRANYNGLLKAQKQKVTDLEARVSEAKMTYNEALKNLEQISEEIHKMRKERRSIEMEFGASNSSQIDSSDEYLDFPAKLSTKSSPVRQQRFAALDCPHLLRDIDIRSFGGTSSESNGYQTDDASPIKVDNVSNVNVDEWTEIRLSNSESTSSGYSQNTNGADDHTVDSDSFSSSEEGRKVTCTTVFRHNEEELAGKKKEGLTTWISKSSLKNTGRRQSLDLLIDASDKVKDVFAQGFQRVGKTLERRNSESEVNNESHDFFLFKSENKDGLSDEQVENLNLDQDSEMFRNNDIDISK
ncbi:SH3 domain-binding protein 5 isoform X1 [Phlebotomus argentipes]|uniref:SH3 domain-binding protein 5 isoform X1 n=1 Tax=Phlebotomus argentipes TaxID=94469 RepID=UPI002893422C|nr:SH3 domain-binding protein 5 isoform X1 [Phlebotomus argentipes]